MFMEGDTVNYVGEKFRGELRTKVGIICARIKNSKTGYVVDFETGDSFVMDETHLVHHRKVVGKEEVEVHAVLRRKRIDEDAENK